LFVIERTSPELTEEYSMRHISLITVCLVFVPSLAACQVTGGSLKREDLRRSIEGDYRVHLGALFDHFHANPEL